MNVISWFTPETRYDKCISISFLRSELYRSFDDFSNLQYTTVTKAHARPLARVRVLCLRASSFTD